MKRIAFVLLCALPSLAHAGGFEVPDQSPAAAATGGASTARSNDPAAAWYNPAALADGGGFRGSFTLTLAVPEITAVSQDSPPLGPPTSTTGGVSVPVALHLSYASADAPYAIGLYAGVPYGSGVGWPEGWWGRFDALSSNIRIFRIAPFFAWRFAELRNFSFAVGVHIDAGSFELTRALDMVDYEGRLHALFSGASAGGDAALYVEPIPELAIGLTYKSRTYVPMSGSADFTAPDAFSARAVDQTAQTELRLPDRFALGAALHLDRVRAYLDLGLSLWSVRDAVRIDFANASTPDVNQPQNWRETFELRTGAEVMIIPEITARAGLRYEMAAVPAGTLSPASPDLDRFGLALGAAIDPIPELGFDVSYGWTALLGGASQSPDAIPASYSGGVHIVSLAVRVHAPNPQPPPPASGEPAPEDETHPPEETAPDSTEPVTISN